MHARRCYGELEELTVDDFWQIAAAGDQEVWRLARSSRRGTSELDAEDNDGLSQQACTALAELMHWATPRHHPSRAAASASSQTSHILRRFFLTTTFQFVLGRPDPLLKSGTSQYVLAVVCVGGPSVSHDRTSAVLFR